jgi:hypothetical protein
MVLEESVELVVLQKSLAECSQNALESKLKQLKNIGTREGVLQKQNEDDTADAYTPIASREWQPLV